MPLTAGQTAVVTGAAGGIGRAIAQRLVTEGLRVVVNDRDDVRLTRTAEEIGAHPLVADLSTDAGVETLVRAATDHLGDIDAWFGNAGISMGHGGLDASDEDWALIHDINVMAHVRTARRLIPAWVERGRGQYVVTASAAGLLTMVGSATYSVTKHAALAFAEWLSVTYRHRGIEVQAICPQGVNTAMVAAAGDTKDLLSHDALLEPEQVADAVWAAQSDGRFLILPHPEVADYYATRATQPDRWLGGMNKLWRTIEKGRENA